jgi:hypothetical protein
MNQKRTALSIFLLLAMAAAPLLAQTPGPAADRKAALDAMSPWLTELDSENYAQSWQEAAAIFQKTVTMEEWVQSARSIRDALGVCERRTLVSTFRQPTPPTVQGHAPSDPIVVAQFESAFENLKHARETVSFEKQTDGVWRAAGYYVKPG